MQRPQIRVWGIPEQMLHVTPEQALEIDKNAHACAVLLRALLQDQVDYHQWDVARVASVTSKSYSGELPRAKDFERGMAPTAAGMSATMFGSECPMMLASTGINTRHWFASAM